MDSAQFKRNVIRTLAVRTAKAGLRTTASNTVSTNVLHAINGFNTEVGGLIQGVNPFLLGFGLDTAMLQSTFTALGGVSYYTVLLAKTLKVKIPGSGKKVHLHGLTKTEALLKLNSLSVELLYHSMGVFNGGDWDFPAIAAITEQIIEVLWPLTYDMLGVPPADVFEDYSMRLAAGFPAGLFSVDKAEYEAAAKVLKEQETAALKAKLDARAAAREQAKLDKQAQPA